ncbi:hypothetical protein V8B55DRAFT_1569087 [Mucor lusitanicus]|uniref:Retrotransposon gag domain-containing protein n=2 Tax=Mucor circinelloides f. lusitanicus TaxID=29924 RepID=A0A162QSE8_MUCCL|nr:hypothetical protein FB192DRAFT_1463889 [Mucor lusitanicus]OAD01819.1 hypothetical protein MUCCIDRAFT_111158 [Mucor lusitanicus CBS 277.49]
MSNTTQDIPHSQEQQLSGTAEQHQPSLVASPMVVDPQASHAADPLLEIKETPPASWRVAIAQEAQDSVQDLHNRLALASSTLKELQSASQVLDRQPAALTPAPASPSTASSEHSQDGYSAASNRSDHAPSYLPRSPEGLPFIQWKSQVFKQGEKKFEDPQICLNYFEVILKQNFIALDQHWKRLVLPKVSDTVMDWVMSVPDETTWVEFKQMLLARYGHSPEMVQADAKQKLITLSMGSNKSITKYIDCFVQLRKKVDLLDSDPILQRALLDPFFADLRRTLNVFNSLNNGATASLEPMSDTIVKIKSIYNLFENQNSWDRLADAFTPSKHTDRKSHRDRRDKHRMREHKPYDRNDSKRIEKSSRPYCSYHKMHRHHTHDCRAKGSQQPLKCFKCAKPIVKGQLHKCLSTADSKYNPHRHHDRSSRDRKQKTSRNNNIVPTPAGSSGKDTDMKDTTDSDQDHNLAFKAANLHLQSSKNTGAPHSPYSGCTFSAISPNLAQHLNVDINKKSGVIQLAQKDVSFEKIGNTAETLAVRYNSKTIQSKFEIFDIIKDIYVCIGMNLLPQLGIQINGLAYDWDGHTGLEIPDIDPSPYTPNDSPYGTDSERATLLSSIQPSIDANKSIPPGAYCNLPNSSIILPIKKHLTHDTFRAPFTIVESQKAIVDEQI